MKLSDFITGMGRVIAFYPGLTKITTSTNATILICQFLYWQDKAKDGWIYKTSDEIAEETGLTYYEQKTARDILVKLGILTEEYKRLDHTIRFRVNLEVINTLWDNLTNHPNEESAEEYFSRKSAEKPVQTPARSSVGKKGDLIDGMIAYNSSPAAKKADAIMAIKNTIQKSLGIIADDDKWREFFEFVYKREEVHKEKLEIFLRWLKSQPNFDPVYWNPSRMKTYWPQAFLVNDDVPFIRPIAHKEEPTDFVPPPNKYEGRDLT